MKEILPPFTASHKAVVPHLIELTDASCCNNTDTISEPSNVVSLQARTSAMSFCSLLQGRFFKTRKYDLKRSVNCTAIKKLKHCCKYQNNYQYLDHITTSIY